MIADKRNAVNKKSAAAQDFAGLSEAHVEVVAETPLDRKLIKDARYISKRIEYDGRSGESEKTTESSLPSS
jgi:hypothetical protein